MESVLIDHSPRTTIFSKSRVRALVAVAAIVVCGIVQQAIGQSDQVSSRTAGQASVDGMRQRDVIFSNCKFRDGETLPQLRMHYATLGNPHRNTEGVIDNAILLLHWTNASSQALLLPEYQDALFAHGAPLDVTRFFVIIPDDVGHGRSSKPSDGLKAAFPRYGYGDIVDLQHRLVTESLGIQHLRAVIGMSMGCMNGRQWAENYPDEMDGIMPIACFPAPISGRNLLWRRMLIDGIRSDPLWENGNYQKQPPSAFQGFLLARMMPDAAGIICLRYEVKSYGMKDCLGKVIVRVTDA